jgi:hypothetical protein
MHIRFLSASICYSLAARTYWKSDTDVTLVQRQLREKVMKLGEMELEAAAKMAAGNWKKFDSFAWHGRPDDADTWAIFYTHHRDSGIVDQSNAAAIATALTPFTETGDVVFESHSHWAVGHIDGCSIRVFRDGEITEAFCRYHDLAERLANYGILDESDYCNREYEETIENLPNAAWRLKREYELPEGWKEAVFDWFANNDCSAIESRDDQGGYPNEEQLRKAFEALSYRQLELV